MRHFRFTCVRIVCLLTVAVGEIQATHAQNATEQELESGEAHELSDQQLQRQKSNAEYVGVPVTTRVSQRFEMYSPH